MKIRKLGSATVLIETQDARILCDPWLTDGAYYGSWCNYPPINLDEYDLSNLDYIYISHIHPDHFDPKTMERVNSSTPVLIHNYHQPFLKKNIIVNLDYDIPSDYQKALLDELVEITPQKCVYQIEVDKEKKRDFLEWAKEVIWYGHRKADYLYKSTQIKNLIYKKN